jgi:S-DNA-T family DNA segregation ATPase FtsK/SpoIIIE
MAKKERHERLERINRVLQFEMYGLLMVAICLISLAQWGHIGRALSFMFRMIVGTWDFTIPILGIVLAFYMMIKQRLPVFSNIRLIGFILLYLILLVYTHLNLFDQLSASGKYQQLNIIRTTWDLVWAERLRETPGDVGGGLIGGLIYAAAAYLFGRSGTQVLLLLGVVIALLLITGRTLSAFFQRLRKIGGGLKEGVKGRASEIKYLFLGDIKKQSKPKKTAAQYTHLDEQEEAGDNLNEAFAKNEDSVKIAQFEIFDFVKRNETRSPASITKGQIDQSPAGSTEKETVLPVPIRSNVATSYVLPGLSLLSNPPKMKKGEYQEMTNNARKLEATLASFGVKAKVTQVHRGPAVTRYELQPDVGVKVSKIVNLSDDIALALAAKDIRMEAPIPNKSAIGIEVPNSEVAIVTLREVLQSEPFQQSSSKLTLALGRDISGEPIIGDLKKMPHLLVAGATGSGKSVCVNGIIASILFKSMPYEVKFLMIDPKMVELNVYNGIPHLLTPVVTDPRKAAIALKKVIAEMEHRYERFAETGARDIERYNQIMTEKAKETDETFHALPYIVVIVDELADLMMVAPADVEDAICRLAQMARAAGIHLIIATQRPSVDIITGVIKANIPSRIAFGVSAQADSRTILDMGGAEKLLGRGDMLFLPVGASKPIRVQGAFLSDREVETVVSFVKEQGQAIYHNEMIVSDDETMTLGKTADSSQDELFGRAVEIVVEAKQASVSLLQRRLRIGYSRAARIIDELEEKGVVGPYEGSKPRDVLWTQDMLQQNRTG